ncbi:NAD(P)-dependent oxidoreductase [Labedaea rhizosphaerae]|uniref:Putative NADH-flavin reductase n=1 Tax=Labedaea rhizosphaerae TaxID=598644 RepID=A0A4R6SJX6_LABRH|nr:NAD(P)H-binding protein [Labedaea rhizosphaerae]TDQ04124.1 putative NADH-flavin reductase [Labedaea rhizosphaerae]
MKLAVFGATGGIGTQVVSQALAAGHQVSAVVRDRARLAVPDQDGLAVVTAGFGDADALASAVSGADAVVSALGAYGRGVLTVCQDGVRAETAAMRAAGVRRLLVISASALRTVPNDTLLMKAVLKPLVSFAFRRHYADLRVMEDEVMSSGLEWTIVCPPRLTDGPRTGQVWHRVGDAERHGQALARADVAGYLLEAAGDRELIGKTVYIGQERAARD